MKYKLGRREFMKRAAVAAAIPAGLVAATPVEARTGEPIPTRLFGKTGLKLPILAYGGAALPKQWGSPLSTEERVKLVRYVYDQGIRYFDTAGNYLESQTIMGKGLKGIRDNVCLVTKVETTNPAHVRGAVEKSMRELQTDHLDAILIHGTPGIQQMSVKRAFEIHAELLKLRDEKMVDFIGLSAHGYFDKALALIESDGFDLCMLAFGYIPRGHDQIFSPRMIKLREACLAKAHELKMGIAAMKVVGAGILGGWAPYVVPGYDSESIQQMPGAAIRWALDDTRIDLLVIGMRLRKDVDENIETLSGDVTCTAEDRALLKAYCARAYESDAIKKMKIE